MNMSLGRVKRLLPDSEYQVVHQLVRANSLAGEEVARLRTLVRGWRDKYVDRAHQQAREARGKGKPRSTRGAESNENTMRQADVMDWALERLDELAAAAEAGSEAAAPTERATTPVPSADEVRKAIGEPHVSTFGDLWAEFPDTPVEKIRKVLWQLVEAGDVELSTAGGIELTAEEEVAFVEEVQTIEGVPVKRRTRDAGIDRKHQDHFARTKVVRIHAHNRSRGARKQARRDNRGR
ncbi:MAG: hypothetical protein EA422_07460 [Gemmatimonadales bacterium]|nr:MAG: hypothetical protein EA422_07460 [Gemmatimonadales bacterium]